MTAAADNRATPRLSTRDRNFPVGASTTIYDGTLVAVRTDGYAYPARISTTDRVVGVARKKVVNGTTAGAVSVEVEQCIARFDNSGSTITSASVGLGCFVVDDSTVSLTDNANTRVRAGRIHSVDSSGVYVDVGAPPSLVAVTAYLADISAASSTYVASPVTGTVVKVSATLHAAITVADSVCTSAIAGVAITGGGLTAAYTASAAGTTFTATPTAANRVSAGQALSFTSGGESSTTAPATITFLISVG